MKFFSKGFGIFEVCLLFLLFYFMRFFVFMIGTDIQEHAIFVYRVLSGESTYVSSIFYSFVISALSGFKADMNSLLVSSVFVMVVFVFFKYALIKTIFVSEFENSSLARRIPVIASIASLALIISFSLPTTYFFKHYYYIGNFPANVWHNSTTIFAMPFVIMLFWLSVKQIDDFSVKRMAYIMVLIVLNVVSKPSFLIVYLIVFPLFMLRKYMLRKLFWINMLPLVVAGFLMVASYVFIYGTKHSSSFDDSSLTISFFEFINYFYFDNSNVFMSIVVFICALVGSFLFPAVVLIRNKMLLKTTMIQFSLASSAIGLIIAECVNETGIKIAHGNFTWQVIMCAFLLFFTTVFQLLKLIAADSRGFKKYSVELTFLALHVISGCWYIGYIFRITDYY